MLRVGRALADKARHEKMVELVDRMQELNKQEQPDKLTTSQFERVDREIDELVCELYGISEQEKKFIEGDSNA
ncbi:MAG TPA: hypothetical protein VKO18_13750 [Terriglobia bacterium]|nr:hypothetical protein [Terriglobia bacterium]